VCNNNPSIVCPTFAKLNFLFRFIIASIKENESYEALKDGFGAAFASINNLIAQIEAS